MVSDLTTASPLLNELTWRGLIAERSTGVEARLAKGPISAYIGFDPSAKSLHVGQLLQVMMLGHLQRAGGTPFVIVGGGTGMIGDPSGKSSERNLLDDAQIAANTAAIRAQLEHFVDFSTGPNQAQMVNNIEWLGNWGLLDFLREIGKHFSVPYMLAKDSVQARLGAGMSFTEFSYMTLQSADFLKLYQKYGVEMQMGGADQWGNITAGLELIRKVVGREEGDEPPAFGLVSPLLLTRDGRKMGKSEKGAVFLDASLTPPFDFYQYWLNDDDALVADHLRWLTLMPQEQITKLLSNHAEAPEMRIAQNALAHDLTERVHGKSEADLQRRLASVIFGEQGLIDERDFNAMFDAVEHFEFGQPDSELDALSFTVSAGLYSSRGEARRAITQGGLKINDQRIIAVDAPLPKPYFDRFFLLRAGKKRVLVARRRV